MYKPLWQLHLQELIGICKKLCDNFEKSSDDLPISETVKLGILCEKLLQIRTRIKVGSRKRILQVVAECENPLFVRHRSEHVLSYKGSCVAYAISLLRVLQRAYVAKSR